MNRSLLLGLAALCSSACGNATAQAPSDPGVFVLGVDGMDPEISQAMMDKGELPNLARLAAQGSFQSLGTANPPQSPVAWSNFVTGMDPGGHGIFDFVHRDPKTYGPISSATPPPGDMGSSVEFFGYIIPYGGDVLGNNRGGTPWWDLLDAAGVDVEVYRIPGNYPVPESTAKTLSGMGTVDMRGGYGTYTLFTDSPIETDDPKGDIQVVSLQDFDLDGVPDTATGSLKGPPDIFHLQPGQIPGAGDYLKARLSIHVDADSPTAVIKIDDEVVLIEEGEWSDWVQVSYDALPYGMMALTGAVRFYAMDLSDGLQIYASPVNMSAEATPQVVTTPDDWVEELYEVLGQFYTQGMPEETDALKDGVFTDDDYLKQVALVQEDTHAMLRLAMDRYQPGDATFVYMSDIDLQCHMLWRHADPKEPGRDHPAREDDVADAHAHDIEGFYKDVDRVLGEVMGKLPEDTLLMVMSDHGFQPYLRELHLNAWLRDEGYLFLKDGKTAGHIALGDVDWSKTRAYNIGFNGLYLNLEGREAEGIVKPGEVDALVKELSDKLEAYRDPEVLAQIEAERVEAERIAAEIDALEPAVKDASTAPVDPTRGQVVLEVARATEAYHGDRIAEAPDMIVGYNAGYGGSDPSTLGEITEAIIEDNTSRWSGNHLMAPQVVPGVLFVNKAVPSDGHDLTDLAATLLHHYGVAPAPGMIGQNIYK